jgi:hypothetical protein
LKQKNDEKAIDLLETESRTETVFLHWYIYFLSQGF